MTASRRSLGRLHQYIDVAIVGIRKFPAFWNYTLGGHGGPVFRRKGTFRDDSRIIVPARRFFASSRLSPEGGLPNSVDQFIAVARPKVSGCVDGVRGHYATNA